MAGPCPICGAPRKRYQWTCSAQCAKIRRKKYRRALAARRRRMAPYFAEQAQRLHKED